MRNMFGLGLGSADVPPASSGGVSPPVANRETRTGTVLSLATGTVALHQPGLRFEHPVHSANRIKVENGSDLRTPASHSIAASSSSRDTVAKLVA